MRYLRFLSDRATGQIATGATFIRQFVTEHPGYNRDSLVTKEINYDLLQMMSGLNDPSNEARRRLLGSYA
jgi:glutamate--cysteine ligase catalytic subunit